MDTARRRPRRVPAFGEWNYYYGGDELSAAATAAAGVCYGGGAPDDQEACSDVWFRYSPAPRKPAPKKARGRTADHKPVGGDNRRLAKTPARTSSSDSGAVTAAHTPAKQQAATAKVVVRRPPAVDSDLYQVPPPDFLPGEPRRRKAGRSLWMGCLGLSC